MPDKHEVSEAVTAAAIALLHREIVHHGQVTLTQEDFLAAEAAEQAGQAIQLDLGPNESIIFTHVKADHGRSVS